MAAEATRCAPLPGRRQQRSPGQSRSVRLLHVLHHDHPATGGGDWLQRVFSDFMIS